MASIKITTARKAECVYLISFLAGILLANALEVEQLKQYGILNEYFVKQLLYASINYNDLLFYVAENRGMVFILLFLLGITRLGIPAHFVYLAWNGFSFGVAMVSVIVNFGIRGIPVLCALLFPHYLFYIPLYLLLFGFTCYLGKKEMTRQSPSAGLSGTALFLGGVLLVLVLFFMGIMTESYVNPQVIKKLVKIL